MDVGYRLHAWRKLVSMLCYRDILVVHPDERFCHFNISKCFFLTLSIHWKLKIFILNEYHFDLIVWKCLIVFCQVVGAKVVTNARSPGSRCYGFVTMSAAEEATKCIHSLHRTELHGKMISVERVYTLARISILFVWALIMEIVFTLAQFFQYKLIQYGFLISDSFYHFTGALLNTTLGMGYQQPKSNNHLIRFL